MGVVVDYWTFNISDNRLDLAMMELKVNDVKLFLFWAYLLFLGLTVT